MTDLDFKNVRCAVCGHEFPAVELLSINQFGAPDLDTRPAEPARSNLKHQVICCYSCAYCSDNIEHIEPELIPVLLSKEYLDIFSAVGYSAQASYFRCKALLDTKRQRYHDAFWATLHAAWTCDDQGDTREARFCRLDALRLFKVAKHAGQTLLPDKENESLLYIDILRRAERFDDAKKEIKVLRKTCKDADTRKVLEFQEQLVYIKDKQAHTVQDAHDYRDKRKMYIADVSKAELKECLKEKQLGFFRDPQEIDMGDIILIKYKNEITHYAMVRDSLTVIYERVLGPYGEFPDLKSHFIVLSHITVLKKPLALNELFAGDVLNAYVSPDEFIKLKIEDQKLIEAFLSE